MRAKYLVRFDDICPTMNWPIWSEIEKILLEFEVAPMLAVVPDNQDPYLQVAPAHPDFWQEVRRWQKQGWTIGLHGYQHRYVTQDGGIIGINAYSEFAGLPLEEQEAKLQKAAAIFHRENIKAEVWIAPAHAFDAATVAALQKIGLHRISDGFFLYPHVDTNGIFWIPQQLWDFRPAPFGIWTVCYHHNSWTAEQMKDFRQNIQKYKNAITNFNEIMMRYKNRRCTWLNAWPDLALQTAFALKRRLRQWQRGI